MNEGHNDNGEAAKETSEHHARPTIRVDKQTPARLGWQSARVTISSPDLPSPVTVTVHWRDSSTCYIGYRKFTRPDVASTQRRGEQVKDGQEQGLQDADTA